MQKTKILFFLPGLYGGGAEKVAVNVLRKLDEKKYELHLVLTEKKGKYVTLVPQYVTIHDLQVKKTMLSILKLRKKVIEINPDIIFSTLFRTHLAIDLALTGLTNKPRTIYRSPNSPKLLLENKQLSFIMTFLLEKAYKNASTIIAQTPEMKDEIIKYHKIDKTKITVFLNPIDSDLIDEKIKNIINPFDNKYINVVAAGRLIEQKGFDILIKSFKAVVESNNNFRLFIIGEDVINQQVELQMIIEDNKLEKYISFLGFQDNPYKYFYYSHMYVLSSRWEGLPNTVLENLYLKKAVIATRCIPFMDSLITNNKNGILIEPEDIEALSSAILNYESIDTSYTTIKFNSNEIDSIFTFKGKN